MTASRARIYDACALLTAVLIATLDQWTKALVVSHLSPPDFGPQIPIINPYLMLYYITNKGAAFSMFDSNGFILLILITLAVVVIAFFYARMLNSGPLLYKLIFGMIIGGAAGNLLDRLTHGSVVDFIWFRIPQIGFSFAVFNLADAAISVGVVLLFLVLLFGGRSTKHAGDKQDQQLETTPQNEPLSASVKEHDAQP